MKTANDFFIQAELSRWVARWETRGLRVLDLGCGRSPYRATLASRGANVISVDLEARSAVTQVLADAGKLPFADATFDKVLLSEVIEHIPNQHAVIRELVRVTRIGGSIFLSSPLHYSLHELPYDYFRPTEYGLRWLFESLGCSVTRLARRGGAMCVVTTMSLQLAYGLMQAPARISVIGRMYTRFFTPVIVKLCEGLSYISFILSYRESRSAVPIHELRGLRKALSLWTNGYCVEVIRGRRT